MPIEHISDTARWVAFYRALESERRDALFNDPFARRLAGAKGEEIVEGLERGRAMAWAMVVRTAVFDEIILRTIEREQVDLVVNLAAGLDARPWRLRLPPALRWVDVDLPAILDYKRTALGDAKPVCVYEAISADLTDAAVRDALIARLGAESTRALVISEGLLIYLTPEQVGALSAALGSVPSFQWWLIDIAGPRILEIMRKSWGKAAARGNAPFQFAPAEGTEFFRRFGWRELEFRSSWEESHLLRREMRWSWLWRLMSRFAPQAKRDEIHRMSGYALLGRAAP